MSETLTKLQNYLQTSHLYDHIVSLLYWDMETEMPKAGFGGHSDAISYFATEGFKRSTSEELYDMLVALSAPEEFDVLDDAWKFIVKRMKRDADKSRRIPVDFFNEYTRAKAESGQAWQTAKQTSDFSVFAPHLEKMIELTRQMYAYTDPEVETYDAMLDSYEEGMDSATYDRLFNDLKAALLPLLGKILAAPAPDTSKFNRVYDITGEKKAERLMLEYIGFSFDKGTTGETEHPFTLNMSSKDVRVSNHFRTDCGIDPLFSAIHEGGHAIFEQNVNPAFDGTVAGSCCYMGVHESQSRFYENILGRNINFWIPVYSKLQACIPEFSDVSVEEFYREINHIQNSFIRTSADEVTYCLHIILRYEIEKEIFRNNVPVSELPALWNKKMQEYLQLTPSKDAEGVLQDMHWGDGSFGYFPSYLLGSIYDGMFLDKITEELGDINTILKEGRILEITEWLNKNIHQYGSTRLPREIISKVCGKEVSAEPLIRYFTEKYTKLYNL